MHKKPFIAVLIIGLLLVSGTAFGYDQNDYVRVRVQGNNGPRLGLSPTFEDTGPLVAVQGGTPRVVPGTYCSGNWQDPYGGLAFTDWFDGYEPSHESGYQDMTDAVIGCSSADPFDVTQITWITRASGTNGAGAELMQPMVKSVDYATLGYEYPGAIQCAGPMYAFALAPGTYQVALPFSVECCVSGEYFATAAVLNPGGFYNDLALTVDIQGDFTFGPVGPQPHWTWVIDEIGTINEYATDIAVDYPYGNGLVWSEGFTPNDVATHCTAGLCDYVWYYGGSPGNAPGDQVDDAWDGGFGLPSGQHGGRTILGERYSAVGLDTLKEMCFLLYGPFTSTPAPSIVVKVWDATGGTPTFCGKSTPGSVLWSTDVDSTTLVFYPATNCIPIPDLVFGTLNGGPPEEFFITIEVTEGSYNAGLGTGLAGHLPGLTGYGIGCNLAEQSIAYYTNYDPPSDDPTGDLGPTWVSLGGRDFGLSQGGEYVMDAYICREDLPVVEEDCAGGGADEWPTYAHDYQNTSASSINVGTACDITLEWVQPLPGASQFTNPTVADDIVYVSSDGTPTGAVAGFDLLTGTPLPDIFNGIPEMGSSNRANTTVHGGYLYITGGNFNAITKQPAGDLDKLNAVWSNNALSQADMGEQNRFGSVLVIDDLVGPGIEAVFVATEPINQPGLPGKVYAFRGDNGDLWSGWAINPISLDKAARHGPSYDGTNLYVGTADADLTAGSIYSIDPATGAINWQYQDNTVDPLNPGGFPGGVSIDGDYLYAASYDANGNGRRIKLDKSGVLPTVEWESSNASALYGAPTIGRNFVYVPQDGANGILMVDKSLGLSVYNFAVDGVGQVTQNVTMSCDNYLFAGDRNAQWHVLDANNLEEVFYRQMPAPGVGFVNGTALASYSGGGDFAVVGIRFDGVSTGLVAAYRLNAGPRPRMNQLVYQTQVLVPLGTVGTLPWTEADVFEAVCGEDVTLSNPVAVDITGAPASVNRRAYTGTEDQKLVDKMQLAKRMDNGEFFLSNYRVYGEQLLNPTASARSNSYVAASASILRTQNILINGGPSAVVPSGGTASLSWEYDVSGLGRGVDLEDIVVDSDDPDFDLTVGSSQATLNITYQGGCALEEFALEWLGNEERFTNNGTFTDAQGDGDGIIWGDNPQPPDGGTMYDGGIFILSDSAVTRVQMYSDRNFFVGDPTPNAGTCGFEFYDDVIMGAYRSGGVPGTPVQIDGDIVITAMSDTNFAPTDPLDNGAIGLQLIVTEVVANDALYGDFKLMHIDFNERNGNPVDIYAGTMIDWDIQPAYGSNYFAAWPATVNGYAIWDEVGVSGGALAFATGMLDPRLASTYSGVTPSSPIHGAMGVDHNTRGLTPGQGAQFWTAAVSESPLFVNEGPNDLAALFCLDQISVPASGSNSADMAIYHVDAHSGVTDIGLIEADAANVAARAARWAGFARGDVNEDGFVDLADVFWQGLVLASAPGYVIYPDTYCADVDANGTFDGTDQTYLLNFVSALGPAPQGAWRF
jgi:hypothetical protein